MKLLLDPPLRRLAKLKLIRYCASLKLAMLLLAILIAACVVGTVAESRLDTAVAQAYVYDAPWFLAWLFVLCANLTCSVFVRYPWKRQQLGFIVTHAGIVILLGGGMIGRIWGVEGNITLFKGDDAQDRILINQTVLQVQTAKSPSPALFPVNLQLHPPSPARPAKWNFRGDEVSVLDYSERLAQQVVVEETIPSEGVPSVQLRLTSEMVPAPIDTWLVLDDPQRGRINFGPLTVQFVRETTSNGSEREHVSPDAVFDKSSERPEMTREKHFVFAKFPAMSMTRSIEGLPSHIKASFQFERTANTSPDERGVLHLNVGTDEFRFPVSGIEGKDTPLAGTPWTIHALQFLPEFRMQGKDAVSASAEPKNPAVVFELVGLNPERGTSEIDKAPRAASAIGHDECGKEEHDCGMEHMKQDKNCCAKPATRAPKLSVETGLTIIYRADGRLEYRSISGGKESAANSVQVGPQMPAGFGSWKFAVQQMISSGVVRERLAPVSNSARLGNLTSGVLVRIKHSGKFFEQWIARDKVSSVRIADEPFFLSFGYQIEPLGFEVRLDNFEVERNEGTSTPSGFKSRVAFKDPRTGQFSRKEVWMNHPAIFPDFPGAGWLGTSYKFSQASWNPDNLNQTTLQVLRDPGWSLKWIGSLLLCLGLFIMFYLKPRRMEVTRL